MKIYISIVLSSLFLCYACKSEIRKEKRLTICFTGDVLFDRGVREEIERKGKGSSQFLFEDVAPLFKSSDAVVVNLECPITDSITPINKRFIFRGDIQNVETLKNSGVTHAVLANNHSMDQGRRGLIATSRHLTSGGIQTLGYGNNQSASCQPVFINKENMEVALFSAVSLPLENWVVLDDQPGVCQASIESICESVKQLKLIKSNCYVVVVLHWGSEYQQQPVLKQRKEAYQLINSGADAIIGHHPHVVQKEEIYKGKPIFYSLGNFVFDQTRPFTDKGLIVQLIFDKDSLSFKKYDVDIKECKPRL